MNLRDTYVRFEDIMDELVSLRTRILYESPVVKDLIIFQYILPYFSKKKDVYVVLYSEGYYYKFKRRANYLMFKDPEMAKILDRIKVIKIGLNDNCEFGDLFGFIKQGDAGREFEGLKDFIPKLKSDSVLILDCDFMYLIAGLSDGDALKRLIDLYSLIPEGLTLFGFKNLNAQNRDIIITDLYDVLITIQRDESTLDNATFRFDIECQLSDICQKFGRFRVESGGRLVSLQ